MDQEPTKFGIAFSVSKDETDDAVDPASMIEHKKQQQLAELAEKIRTEKPSIWQTQKIVDTNSTVYEARLYIFTPAELKAYIKSIIPTGAKHE